MVKTKGTTPKAPQFKMNQDDATTNNGGGESSFRVLYYGDASAGSVPFMWESHPGTPKHPTTEPIPPPLTPPPAFHQHNTMYNSSKHKTSFKTLFLLNGSRKCHVSAPPASSTSDSFTSYNSCSTQPTTLRSLFLASSSRRDHVVAPVSKGDGKTEFRRNGGGSTTAMRCFGGGLLKVYRMKKVKSALMSFGSHGKIHNK